MQIDLRPTQQRVRDFIARRVNEYGTYPNKGPGPADGAVSQVTFGYSGSEGYVALVFDTRTEPDIDGEWTGYMTADNNIVPFPEWTELLDHWAEEEAVQATLPNGETLDINNYSHSYAMINQLFGELIRETVFEARDTGIICRLPLATYAYFHVEEINAEWAWPQYKERKVQGLLHRTA